MNFKYTSLAALLALTLSGCGIDKIVPDNTTEYRQAETMPPLDIPPDLSTARINDDIAKSQSGSATYSEFEEEANNPLANKYNITQDIKPALAGVGIARHLIIPSSTEETWTELESLLGQKSLTVKRADQRIGIMDTEVGADDYAYRLRVERGDTSKQSLVYINAAGVADNAQKNEAMLRQVADHFGLKQQEEKAVMAQEAAVAAPVAVVATLMEDDGGKQYLLVEQDYTDVWNRVGRVLDSKGFTVEDRDRSRGTYLVHYIDSMNNGEDEPGMLSSLAFWRDDIDKMPEQFYNIKLISDASDTKIIIQDAEGVRSTTDTAERLLTLFQEQLSQ